MKTELIETLDINDEYQRYFYSTEHKNKIDRREFLRYCAIGSTGLLLPLTGVVHANPLFFGLLRVLIPIISLATAFLSTDTPSTGDVYLVNNTNIKVRGDLELTLLDSRNNSAYSAKRSNYIVPANKVQKYRFENGPSVSVDKDVQAYLSARSRIDRRNSSNFTIKCS